MPHARPEEAPRAALVAVVLPEAHRLTREPQVDGQAGRGKGPLGHAGGAERHADGDEDEAVAQGHARVARRVGPREHAQARGLVLLADGPAQGHEVGKLPCEEQGGEQPAAYRGAVAREKQFLPGAVLGGGLAGRGGPPHQRGDASHESTDPGVKSRDTFQWRVDSGIKYNVGETQEGDCGVDAKV